MSTFRAWLVVGALSLGAALSYARANNSIPASVRVTPSERAARLEAQLQQTLVPQERVQIRYVLGNVLQDLGDTTRALQVFSGLEKDYPLLKERILTKEAQLSGDSRKWQEVAQQNGPLRPEALYQLGRSGDQSSFQQLMKIYTH
jgi:hypothetical protein